MFRRKIIYKAELAEMFAERGIDASELKNITKYRYEKGCCGTVSKRDEKGCRTAFVFTHLAAATVWDCYGAEVLVQADGTAKPLNDPNGGKSEYRMFDTIKGLVDFVCEVLA